MRRLGILLVFLLAVCLRVAAVESDELYGTVYVVRYEGFGWSPCTYSGNTVGLCLAINCGPGGCVTSAETVVCPDVICVKNILTKRGKEHLTGVYRLSIPWQEISTDVHAKKLQVIESFALEGE